MSDLRLDKDDLTTPSGNIENNITNSAFFDMLINNTEYKMAQRVELKHKKKTPTRHHITPSGCHIASTGKQYHSHAATIYKWAHIGPRQVQPRGWQVA